jgi:hypothetical protein
MLLDEMIAEINVFGLVVMNGIAGNCYSTFGVTVDRNLVE